MGFLSGWVKKEKRKKKKHREEGRGQENGEEDITYLPTYLLLVLVLPPLPRLLLSSFPFFFSPSFDPLAPLTIAMEIYHESKGNWYHDDKKKKKERRKKGKFLE